MDAKNFLFDEVYFKLISFYSEIKVSLMLHLTRAMEVLSEGPIRV